MAEYRDPFDLSPLPNADEKKMASKKKIRTRAVVRRVGIGPLLHSRFTKLLSTLGIIVLAGLLGYVATYYYLAMHK